MSYANFEYGSLLPFIAKMPLRVGSLVTHGRGVLNAVLDRDWRSIALNSKFVADSTTQAFRDIHLTTESGLAGKTRLRFEHWLYRRFVAAAYEEWHANLITFNRVNELAFDGIKDHQNLPKQLIIATIHFDSPMLGLVKLGDWGRPICALSSSIVEDSRIPVEIRSHFNRKYRAMAGHWHGGRCMHKESELRGFIEAAHAGFSLAVFCDVPGVIGGNAVGHDRGSTDIVGREPGADEAFSMKKNKGVWLNFIGRRRLIAPIIPRLLEITNLPVVGMVCTRTRFDKYKISFSDVFTSQLPGESTQRLYDFFSECIVERPYSWWACDLLPNYPLKLG